MIGRALLLALLALCCLTTATRASLADQADLDVWQRLVDRCVRLRCDSAGDFAFPAPALGRWMNKDHLSFVSEFIGALPSLHHVAVPPPDDQGTQDDSQPEHSQDGLVHSSDDFPWWFRWSLYWTCPRNCMYEAMIQDRDDRRRAHVDPIKYNGKWPFDRVLGLQEWFSAVFSIGNGVVHVIYLPRLVWPRPPLAHVGLWAPGNYRAHWISFCCVAINTWLWSAVFHSMDTKLTQDLDYFCAFAVVVWGLWVAVCRTVQLPPGRQLPLLLVLLAGYFVHVHSMVRHFDYGYNTMVNAAVAFVSSFFWLVWSLRRRDRHYVWILVVAIVGVYPMTLLEFYDFPPFFNLLDAHSLWHLSTIPFTFVMYEGVIRDLNYEAQLRLIDAKALV